MSWGGPRRYAVTDWGIRSTLGRAAAFLAGRAAGFFKKCFATGCLALLATGLELAAFGFTPFICSLAGFLVFKSGHLRAGRCKLAGEDMATKAKRLQKRSSLEILQSILKIRKNRLAVYNPTLIHSKYSSEV